MTVAAPRSNDKSVQPTPSPGISARLVLLLSVAAAATVANLYYAQPLLPEMARSFGVSAQEVGWVPVLTQVGYAVGLLLFIPLGDAVERRRLTLALVGASAGALLAAAVAPGAAWLAAASLAVGFFTVVPHVALPLAAHLADPGERGRVIGLIMSGILAGILLARTVAGPGGRGLRLAGGLRARRGLHGAALDRPRPAPARLAAGAVGPLRGTARLPGAARPGRARAALAGPHRRHDLRVVQRLLDHPRVLPGDAALLLGRRGGGALRPPGARGGARRPDGRTPRRSERGALRRRCLAGGRARLVRGLRAAGPAPRRPGAGRGAARRRGAVGPRRQPGPRPRARPGGAQPPQHRLHGGVLRRRRARHLAGRAGLGPLRLGRGLRRGRRLPRAGAPRLGAPSASWPTAAPPRSPAAAPPR